MITEKGEKEIEVVKREVKKSKDERSFSENKEVKEL